MIQYKSNWADPVNQFPSNQQFWIDSVLPCLVVQGHIWGAWIVMTLSEEANIGQVWGIMLDQILLVSIVLMEGEMLLYAGLAVFDITIQPTVCLICHHLIFSRCSLLTSRLVKWKLKIQIIDYRLCLSFSFSISKISSHFWKCTVWGVHSFTKWQQKTGKKWP